LKENSCVVTYRRTYCTVGTWRLKLVVKENKQNRITTRHDTMMVHNYNHNHNHNHNNNGNISSAAVVMKSTTTSSSNNNNGQQRQQRRRSSRNNLVSRNTIKSIISHSLVGIFCLYIGTLIGMSNQISGAVKDGVVPSSPAVVVPLPISMARQPNQNQHRLVAAQRRDEEEEDKKKNDKSLISSPSNSNYKQQLKQQQQQNNRNSNSPFPKTSNKMFIDYRTISRDTFLNNTNMLGLGDLGVPLDSTQKGAEDVLIIYTSQESLPTSNSKSTKSTSTSKSKTTNKVEDEQNNNALENCHTVKVILQSPSKQNQKNKQCLVIIPQWDSYTIHKYMRLENIHNSSSKVDLTQTFKNVPRSREADGTVLGYVIRLSLSLESITDFYSSSFFSLYHFLPHLSFFLFPTT
jgi:hypothetical protein